MNADNILFHPHYTGDLMTDPQSKAAKERGELGETCKKRLVKVFVEERYGRESSIENKYIKKGLETEEECISLYSRIKKTLYFKNVITISNEFLIGTPDFGDNRDIKKSTVIFDTKSCWDLNTFWTAKSGTINKDYYWQIQAYCALTGAEKGILAYCLINTPAPLIYDEQRKLQWKMGVINPDKDETYQQACAEIEKNMTFDDIPLEEKMFEIQINRNDADIERLYERIRQCREYMSRHLFQQELKAA